MLSNELLSELHELDRVDKLRAMQFLVGELARDEGAVLALGALYEVWSPYDAPRAADALLKLLEQDEQSRAN